MPAIALTAVACALGLALSRVTFTTFEHRL
jgi:hypothetical protein